MRKFISILLIFAFLLSAGSTAFADSKGASLSMQKLIVDGKLKSCEIYNIFNNNYFKLRDIAYALNGSGSQFSVAWDSENSLISIQTGKPYETVGGEFELRGDLSRYAKKTELEVMVNGEKISKLAVYNIGGNNFFKLRDLGSTLGFDVDYNPYENAAVVTSKTGQKSFIAASYAESCGLPGNISKISYPKTNSDYTLNFLYEMLQGNYTPSVKAGSASLSFTPALLSSLCGALENQSEFLKLSSDNGKWSLSASKNLLLSNDEIFTRNKEAYKKAVELATEMWNAGQLSKDMSDMQKAQACYNKFKSLGVNIAERQSDSFYSIQYDDAYSSLVSKNCNPSGSSAGFVMLLRVVGIKALSLPCRIIKTGSETEASSIHIMQYLLINGEEYFSDIHSGYGIMNQKNIYTNGRQYDAEKFAIAKKIIRGNYSTLMTGEAYKLSGAKNGKLIISVDDVDILPSRASEIIKNSNGGYVYTKSNQKHGVAYGSYAKEDTSYLSIENRQLVFDAQKFVKDKNLDSIDDIIAVAVKAPNYTIKAYR